MTSHHPLRRTLARLCSAATMARVVDPILADIRWEERSRWLGYAALARALAVHTILSIPETMQRTWSEDGHALPRMGAFTVVASLFFTLPIVAPAFPGPDPWALLLLVPQGMAWTLPAVLLAAIPIGLRGRVLDARFLRRSVALACAVIGATFVLMVWVAPAANGVYRDVIHHALTGDGVVREFPNWSAAPPPRLAAYQVQQRLAFGFGPLPLALLGLGLTRVQVTRRRPWLTGLSAAALYMFGAFPVVLWIAALLLRASTIPPFVLAWTSNAIVFTIGVLLLTRGRIQRSANATPANP